jgi:nucleoside-diphosphate-sugar epimerase
MNLTVLGAAGATGIPLVEQALAGGHHVTALVRSRQTFGIADPNLDVVEGDATDREAVSRATSGAPTQSSASSAREGR